MRYNLTGRTIAITGGCGGLGIALAEALRAKHSNVALLDLDARTVETQAERLGEPRFARGWVADVRDLTNLTDVMREVREHFGRLDVVIAGAGVLGPVQALSATSASDWDRVIDVNLGGVWRTFKAAAPHVAEQRRHLLAMPSMVGLIHPPMLGYYAASKAGGWALCDALRLELRTVGVSVGSHAGRRRARLLPALVHPAGAGARRHRNHRTRPDARRGSPGPRRRAAHIEIVKDELA